MATKANFFSDNEDILFHIEKRIDFNELFNALSAEAREVSGCAGGDEYRKMIQSMLESVGEVCGSDLAPESPQVEREEILLKSGEVILPKTVRRSVAKLIEIGCASLGIQVHFGGAGIPFLPETIAHEMIMRACPSTGLNLVWYSSIAHVLEQYADQSIKDEVIPKIAQGEWSGSMALTEPDAGSDLGALRTYGVLQPDGSWRLFGSKRFISNGASQVCLVLAMNGKGAKGLHNLNLYLCLREEAGQKNYKVTKIEEKIGLHGSATCELQFDGARARLIGKPNEGFQQMLKLMNDARIAVGFQGLGNMEAIVRMTKEYCLTRTSWGKPLAAHEMVAEKLLDMEVDLKAARSLCYKASFYQSMMYLWDDQLKVCQTQPDKVGQEFDPQVTQAKLEKARARVRRWTPLIKWYVAEKTVDMARMGLQLHGGYGFTKEYRCEFWLRESLILPLYEGTSQIQALMCIKDALKEIIRSPRRFFEGAFGLKVQAFGRGDNLQKKLLRARQVEKSALLAVLLKIIKLNLKSSLTELKPTDLIKIVRSRGKDLLKMENVGPALLHAERVCEIQALVELGAALVEDAVVESSRRFEAERFLERHYPRLLMLKSEIERDDRQVQSYIESLVIAKADVRAMPLQMSS